MLTLRKGRYTARIAQNAFDIDQCQALRHLCFLAQRGLAASTDTARDADAFDDKCHHILVEDTKTATLVCAFRLFPLKGGTDIANSYSAQYYDLAGLSAYDGAMVELGRFCIHPDYADPDILRVAWGAMARYVDDTGVEMLFGCSSFYGADAARHHDALALLKDAHLAPKRWLPQVKAPNVFRFARRLRPFSPDPKRALTGMPPLLRTYLAMGGWVSDHAVVDADLNTIHVFTALEIRSIPPARARMLRAIAN